jgi:acyl carrier protein
MSDELFDRFVNCAVKMLSVEASQVTRDATFGEDLDADSLDVVEFVMELEEEFGISVPEEELADVKTVGQAFDIIAAKVQK